MAEIEAAAGRSPSAMKPKERINWLWQLGLRGFLVILLVVDLILAAYGYGAGMKYEFWDGLQGFLLIPICLALLWDLIYVPLSFRLKSRLHPGFAVGFDLILWLACIIIGVLFLVVSIFSYGDYSPPSDPYSGYYYESGASAQGEPITPSSSSSYDSGYIYQSNNGTQTFRNTTDPNYSCPYFNSCADQDHAVSVAHQLYNIIYAAQIILIICGLIHFVLWVWACVDCARYNSSRYATGDYTRARLIAEEMVRDMQDRGEILMVRKDPTVSVTSPDSSPVSNRDGVLSGDNTAFPSIQESAQDKGKDPIREGSGVRYA